MPSDNDILKELKEISPLMAECSNKNTFSVPEEYFETLSDLVLFNAKKELSFNVGSETFKVPERYFDNLSASILSRVKTADDAAEELKVLSPLLYSIRDINVYKAPKGYFNKMQGIVLKTPNTTQAGVFRIPAFRQILKYAAAAVTISIISLSVYRYAENPFIKNISAINSPTLTPSIEKGKNMNEQQFNEELNILSNEDISAYLEKNAGEVDISSITHNLKADALPSKDDYFLNEETLENYLDSIEIKNK